MNARWAGIWRIAKMVLAVAIIAGVGWHFTKLLGHQELWNRPVRLDPIWVAACAVLYFAAFSCWGAFWLRAVRSLGDSIPLVPAMRAYFVSQLGKYVPGKAVAVLIRVEYARDRKSVV